jgi:hypothetical protein
MFSGLNVDLLLWEQATTFSVEYGMGQLGLIWKVSQATYASSLTADGAVYWSANPTIGTIFNQWRSRSLLSGFSGL